MSATPRVARHLVVHGRVQGVFFRSTTRELALRHGVDGWVRNRADGTVEAWLEGDDESVAAVEAWIRAGGPSSATVRDVVASPAEPAGCRGFDITG